jgi:HD-GYP domain-containing protein (c-di-GMP phosphodiesterase class II)
MFPAKDPIPENATVTLVETLAEALDARDPYTAGHSLRVAGYAREIALELGLPEREIEMLHLAAQLHDIGKIGIPDAVLLKPAPLTAQEFGLIKLHPQIGRRILEKSHTFPAAILDVVELHHENFDGTGYPYGLEGKRIPRGACIVHVADALDAMTTHRAYRPAFSLEQAIDEVHFRIGRQFDPDAVEALLAVVSRGAGLGFSLVGSQGLYNAAREAASTQIPQTVRITV